MPKRDDALFQRLRHAGVRKEVARALSELSGDAGNKAVAAGHRAVAELRVLADEIEKRLPEQPSAVASNRAAKAKPTPKTKAPKTKARTSKATKAAPKSSLAKAPASKATTRPARPVTAPRGENRQKILAALKSGPQTASQVSKETGIATPTVSTALSRLSKTGDVVKAQRGYELPRAS